MMSLFGFKNTLLLVVVILFSFSFSCQHTIADEKKPVGDTLSKNISPNKIILGADQTEAYLRLIKGKTIGIVANQTSLIDTDVTVDDNNTETVGFEKTHLVDFLYRQHIKIKAVFSPEHGFRGTADAGESVQNGIDTKTGLPIISLYGKNKKPTAEQLNGIEVMIFDIQDVGARFYTYISTLHYVMEACAENNIPLIVLDRPNPNGHYIDGPILEKEFLSFVGMHPVPVVHGMTIGEYARMINGEKWLTNGLQCELQVVKMKHYTHQTPYSLPVKPSPNLPNEVAVNLYPSLCFFEGTPISVGRGTEMQFQIFGAPFLPKEQFHFTFTPQPNEGAKYPKHQGKLCYGKDLRNVDRLDKLNLEWLISAYTNSKDKARFFTSFFTKLAGTRQLQKQIEQGYTYREIRTTWLEGLKKYDTVRRKYLLYD